MRKLAIILTATVAMLFAGLLAWNAEATTVTGAVPFGTKNFSPIVLDIGCRSNAPLIGANGCRRGTHQACKKNVCACIPC
jgi:hypothetical protein